MTIRAVVGIAVVLAILEPSLGGPPDTASPHSSIPYVATRNDAVRDMLWMANVGKDDIVYDLGSGDGRIVIAAVRDFSARQAVGVENDLKVTVHRHHCRRVG
jgi:predicted RNA methylase